MKTINYQPAVYICFLPFLFFSCNYHTQENNNAAELVADSMESVIKLSAVTEEYIHEELELNGDVACDESRMSKIFVPCSGKVSGIKVEVGDRVRQGEALAGIHATAAADHNKQLSEVDAAFRIAERELKMKQEMQSSGMASERDVAEAQEKVSVIKAEKQRLQAVAGINGYVGRSHAVLRSPISGYVIRKNIYNGSYVDDNSDDAPAFEIADLSQVWVIANVYENDISKIRQAASVRVTTMAYPGWSTTGKIDKIYHVMDNDSKTMKVRVKLHNEDVKLKPGMFANVHLVLGKSAAKMPCVPAEAVIFENGHHYVVVVDDKKKYHRRQITIAYTDDKKAFVSSGIEAGKQVVSTNALLMYNALAQ